MKCIHDFKKEARIEIWPWYAFTLAVLDGLSFTYALEWHPDNDTASRPKVSIKTIKN